VEIFNEFVECCNNYKHDYARIFVDIAKGELDKRKAFRELIKTDRFFVVYFVMGIAKANHPFVVQMCRMCEEGRESGTIDIWAREHFKSTIITIAGTVQRIVNDAESTTVIFSYKKPAAEKFLDAIRKILENDLMRWCFPDILYEKPDTQSSSWSLQGGIRVKRKSTSRKEHTVEAAGLIDGMPTGGHWDHRIYDDCETADLATSPEQLKLCYERFEISRNLGVDGGTEQIIGTYYSHNGVLIKMGNKLDIYGDKMYELRLIPATEDGTILGKPVFFSQKYLDSMKTDGSFNSQQLCNPTPSHNIKLDFGRFKVVKRDDLPKDRIKFIIIDPAGDKEVQSGNGNDSWAMLCVSVRPYLDELGNSDVYIEDGIVGQMGLSSAIDAACSLYIRNGRVEILGIEKVANDTTYEHIRKGLVARGRYLSIKKKGKYGGNLLLLSPEGRGKNYRIEAALSWPLNNGKLHYVDDLCDEVVFSFQEECSKFPLWHVDNLDCLAYLYDILADPTSTYMFQTEVDEDDDLELENESVPKYY
jgi:hypothetical protein